MAGQTKPVNLVTDTVWLIFSNLDYEWKSVCNTDEEMATPYLVGDSIRNLFPPYDIYTVSKGIKSACIEGIILSPFGFKVFVKASEWVATSPTLLSFKPGHDSRILRPESTKYGEMKVPFSFSFSDVMDCVSVLSSMSFEVGNLIPDSIKCKTEQLQFPSMIQPVKWTIEGILDKVPDGVFSASIGKNAKTIDARSIKVISYFCMKQ